MNNALSAALEESGLSYAGLARRVNALGAAGGHALRYDYTAVGRWVKKDQVPRHPTPTLVAQALSERLGRRVTPADLGMPDGNSLETDSLHYPIDATDALDVLRRLNRDELDGGAIKKAPFIADAFAAPSRDWLISSLHAASRGEVGRAIGLLEVAGIRDMFALFQEMDVMRGGGHGRTALVEYMRSYVSPLLRSPQSSTVRAALLEAAAESFYLAGWMAYDDGCHGLAQRYLIQALRLAQEAGSTSLGAHILAGMSDQANLLGYPVEAARLADAGLIASGESIACRADLLILRARALASSGNRTAATASVAEAEETFCSVDRENEPKWAKFIDPAYVFGEASIALFDVGDMVSASEFADRSLTDAVEQGRARRASLTTAVQARIKMSSGDVDHAAEIATRVVDFAAAVNSSRSREAVRQLSRDLGRTPTAAVAAFDERARELSLIA